MTNVDLLLLGPPELHVRGRRVDLGPKRLAVLAYLALNGTTRRRALAELLWPDSDNPLNNLAVARNDLSRLLGPGGLEVDAQTMALGSAVQVDAQQWRSLEVSAAERWGLYRGEFLKDLRISDWANGLGSEFEQWLFETRDAFAAEHRGLALELGLSRLRLADVEGSLPYLLAAHNGEEPREDATHWYMLALGANEQVNLAVAAFAQLQTKLRDELEVDPSSSTRAALQLAREDPVACRARIAQELQTLQGTGDTIAPAKTVPLVGRETELNFLRNHLEQPAPGLTLIVRGEAGVGKTRLVQTLFESVQAHWQVFSLEFTDGQAPLASLERAVRNLVAANPARAQELPSLAKVALARFVPSLVLEEPPASDPELERVAAFSAIRTLLEPVGALILHLEDLQWADRQSLEFVQYLRSNPPNERFVQVVTWRDTDQAEPVKHLEAALRTWTRGANQTLALSGLTDQGVQSLVDHFERAEVDAHDLRQQTGGNPLYVTEWLSSKRHDPSDHVQQSLANLIRSRLNALTPSARQVLEALAIVGPDARMGLLQRTSGRSPEETALELDALQVAQLIQPQSNPLEMGLRFNHDLVRDVIFEDLSPARRAILNLRAARASQTNPVQAAAHYWQGHELMADDEQNTIRNTYIAAGVQLGLRGEIDEAMVWYDRALTLSVDTNERVSVMTNQARTLERFAHYDEASQLLERIEPMLEMVEPVTAATANNIRSDLVLDRYGDVTAGLEYANAAMKILEGVTSVAAQLERGRAKHLLGWCAFRSREYEEAEQQFRAAMATHDSLGNQADMASSMVGLGLTRMYQSKSDVRQILEEASELAKKSNNLTAFAYAFDTLGHFFLAQKEHSQAITAFSTAISTRSMLDEGFMIGVWLSNLGNVYFELGKIDVARDYYIQALHCRDVKENTHYLRIIVLRNLAEASVLTGNYSEARQVFEESIQLMRSVSLPDLQVKIYWWLGELETLEKNVTEAKRAYEEALKISISNKMSDYQIKTLCRLARLTGDTQYAQRSLLIGNTPESRASLLFTNKDFNGSRAEFENLTDAFETLRLELDIARATGDFKLEADTLKRLAL